jgi:hypothetical protein
MSRASIFLLMLLFGVFAVMTAVADEPQQSHPQINIAVLQVEGMT